MQQLPALFTVLKRLQNDRISRLQKVVYIAASTPITLRDICINECSSRESPVYFYSFLNGVICCFWTCNPVDEVKFLILVLGLHLYLHLGRCVDISAGNKLNLGFEGNIIVLLNSRYTNSVYNFACMSFEEYSKPSSLQPSSWWQIK